MLGGNFPNMSFQSFYISKEESNCPCIIDIVRIGKKLKESKILEEGSAIISIGYGKRMLINSSVQDYSEIKREELLEVADYNPIKNNLLLIGPGEPCLETPIHWMVINARKEVNAMIQINNIGLIEKIGKNIPVTEKEYLPGTFEQIKDVLRLLRDSKIVIVKNRGIIFVGNTIKDVEKLVFEKIKGIQ